MARILFFTSEPGGAEVLAPLIPITRDAGHEVRIAAYGHGAARLHANGIAFRMVEPILSKGSPLLDEERPDFVITSATSLPERDMSERYLWRHARQMGTGTLAFIDQWQNYGARFRGPGIDTGLAFMPDHINCIDDIGRAEMLAEGFPEKRLVSFGLPQLADLMARIQDIDTDSLLQTLGIPPALHHKERTFLFVSEPLAEHFGESRGYNQYSVLNLFLESVRRHRPREKVIIKLHPKDDRQRFREIEESFADLDTHFVQNEITHLDCLCLADRVFGMTSVMLVEAYLLGKVTVTLQPGLKGADNLVLSRLGLIPRIEDPMEHDPLAFTAATSPQLKIDFDRAKYLEFLSGRTSEVIMRRRGVRHDS